MFACVCSEREKLRSESMAVDPRQVLAGVLTMTMFVMLGNMIKRDHFDSVRVCCLYINCFMFTLFFSGIGVVIGFTFLLINLKVEI